MNKKDYKAFYRFSEFGYTDPNSESDSLKEQFNIVQKTPNGKTVVECITDSISTLSDIHKRTEVR